MAGKGFVRRSNRQDKAKSRKVGGCYGGNAIPSRRSLRKYATEIIGTFPPRDSAVYRTSSILKYIGRSWLSFRPLPGKCNERRLRQVTLPLRPRERCWAG